MNKAILRKILLPVVVVLLAALVAAPMVMAAPATATRDLPSTVAPGAEFSVAIVVSGCGSFGQVKETLPTGFTYVSVSDPGDIAVSQVGQVVTFTFLGGSITFTYTVEAPATEDTYTFAGVVIDDDQSQFTVGGDTQVEVAEVVTYDLTISVSPTGTGTTDPAVGTHTYVEDTDVTITASAATGYRFSHWSGDASGTSSTTTVTMDDDKSVTANFEVYVAPESFLWWLFETFIEDYL